MHAELAAHVTPFNERCSIRRRAHLEPGDEAGRMALNAEITRQATIIAYANDFKLMMIVALAAAAARVSAPPPARRRRRRRPSWSRTCA